MSAPAPRVLTSLPSVSKKVPSILRACSKSRSVRDTLRALGLLKSAKVRPWGDVGGAEDLKENEGADGVRGEGRGREEEEGLEERRKAIIEGEGVGGTTCNT